MNLSLTALALLVFCLNGCAPLARLRSLVAQATGPSARIDSHVALLTSADQNMIDLQKLAEFWYRCTQASALSDCPICLGDVLEIFVPAGDELKSRVARVSDEGMIFLFYIRVVQAGGLSEKELRAELRHWHDVIEVAGSAPKPVPSGIYRFFSYVFHIGARVSVPVL